MYNFLYIYTSYYEKFPHKVSISLTNYTIFNKINTKKCIFPELFGGVIVQIQAVLIVNSKETRKSKHEKV